MGLAVWACRCVTRRQATRAHALVTDRTRRRIGRVTIRCWLVALTRSLRDRTVEVTLKNKGTGVSAGTAVGAVHSHSAVEAPSMCPTCIDTLRRQCQGLDAKSPREEALLPLRMELRDRIRSAQNVPQLRSRLAEATSLRAELRTVREGAVGAAHTHSAVETPFTCPTCVDSLRRECQGLDAKSPREEGPLPLRMELQDRFRFAQNVPQLRSRLAEATSLGAELRTVRQVFIHNTTQSLSQERGMASEMLDARLHEAHHRVSQLEQALWSELERAADRNTRAEVASSRLWQHVKDTER